MWHSKALRHVTSRSVELADMCFWIGSNIFWDTLLEIWCTRSKKSQESLTWTKVRRNRGVQGHSVIEIVFRNCNFLLVSSTIWNRHHNFNSTHCEGVQCGILTHIFWYMIIRKPFSLKKSWIANCPSRFSDLPLDLEGTSPATNWFSWLPHGCC